MDIYHKILKRYWGYASFRPLQEDIIRSVAGGRDTLGLMPTGGGKSITFQVPALATEGVCLVVTPLIALMKDQVDNLRRTGIKATAIYSGMTRREILTQLDNCILGDYKFLYISPERLATEIFLAKLQSMHVSFLVVDESHCISQWGYDFRPAYLSIATIREHLPEVPVLALTATATSDVIDDIQEKLLFKKKNVYRKSFYRANISYVVRHTDNKRDALMRILKKVDGSAIVYVRSRMRADIVAKELQYAGVSAEFFHAGLSREEKTLRQNKWKNNECRVIVSTNAFGMGIDKPDVRLVVHVDIPGSIEEYFQEAGRAGRDEEKAYAVALCSGADDYDLRKRHTEEYPDKVFIARVYEALCNYFQIALGYGLNSIHDFTLADFCSKFKFKRQLAHSALKILELSGYIEYTEEVENASRLLFIVMRDDLYKYQSRDEHTDDVIRTALRLYSGLFTDYAYIDEAYIANICKLSRNEVYEILTRLSKLGIVSYIPRKKTPLIIFVCDREEQRYLVIPSSAYEDRKKRSEKRMEETLRYMNEEYLCRSRILLHYFGERYTKDCGCCDICLKKNASGLNNAEFNAIKEALLEALTANPCSVKSLVEYLPFPIEKSITVIRFLADKDEHFILEDGYIHVSN
ncbi:MAG: RecQ family ATP-dependent DNA helicase [Tannerellaceae bacterium]|nr:RecQ family ATP-dependent DNA helicase [Tannerellaceae bacterium]